MCLWCIVKWGFQSIPGDSDKGGEQNLQPYREGSIQSMPRRGFPRRQTHLVLWSCRTAVAPVSVTSDINMNGWDCVKCVWYICPLYLKQLRTVLYLSASGSQWRSDLKMRTAECVCNMSTGFWGQVSECPQFISTFWKCWCTKVIHHVLITKVLRIFETFS